jgi:dihydroneopterin aldolase/2-amino-4-hydroxy-6-hydroxymethyldihydropteridine diphosphokinase
MSANKQLVEAYVAVGSNIEPETNIVSALKLLRSEVEVTGISTFYRTRALNRPEQPDFLNGVLAIRTKIEPRELKYGVLRPIEEQLGRVRSEDKFAPRTIDLDIVLYGDRCVQDGDLHIPDPDIRRSFVGIPVLELATEIILPDSGEALSSFFTKQDRQQLQAEVSFSQQLKEGA